MEFFLAFLAGCILTLVIPIFFDRSREERGRLAGMLFGGYLGLLSLFGAALVTYSAFVDGAIGIGRRGRYASFIFSEQPVAATLTLLVTLLCVLALAAFGWFMFKASRDRTLGP